MDETSFIRTFVILTTWSNTVCLCLSRDSSLFIPFTILLSVDSNNYCCYAEEIMCGGKIGNMATISDNVTDTNNDNII